MEQRDRAMLRVTEYFAKSLKITHDHSKYALLIRAFVSLYTVFQKICEHVFDDNLN